jgi:protein-S-isoprenylcysteine O-methyltransferase Ste14
MRSKTGAVVGSLIFFGVAPGVVAGWIPCALSGWRLEPAFLGFPAGRIAGVILIVIGLGVLVDCFRRFALEGVGTPAPVAPTKYMVGSGPYRYVRNPMYLAVISIILGQALLLGSVSLLAYSGVVWLLFHLFVWTYEEPTLRKQFGESYRVYQTRVRRWWPRMKPWN